MAEEKNPRCSHENCKKKINPVDTIMSVCKCKKQFCKTHRLSESHSCTYNYRNINREEEINKLVCVSDKVVRL